jgi:hypothetical protein
MRTFGSQHFSSTLLAVATSASLLGASLAAAPLAAQSSSTELTPSARLIPARCTDSACGGNYQLAIVAALYPYDDGSIRGPSVLTLVIENRGSAPAPLAALEVVPVAHFANAAFISARRAPVAVSRLLGVAEHRSDAGPDAALRGGAGRACAGIRAIHAAVRFLRGLRAVGASLV